MAEAARFFSHGWLNGVFVSVRSCSFGLSLGLLPAACLCVSVGRQTEQLVQRRCGVLVSHLACGVVALVCARSERASARRPRQNCGPASSDADLPLYQSIHSLVRIRALARSFSTGLSLAAKMMASRCSPAGEFLEMLPFGAHIRSFYVPDDGDAAGSSYHTQTDESRCVFHLLPPSLGCDVRDPDKFFS